LTANLAAQLSIDRHGAPDNQAAVATSSAAAPAAAPIAGAGLEDVLSDVLALSEEEARSVLRQRA
jgi:hypothetical protein